MSPRLSNLLIIALVAFTFVHVPPDSVRFAWILNSSFSAQHLISTLWLINFHPDWYWILCLNTCIGRLRQLFILSVSLSTFNHSIYDIYYEVQSVVRIGANQTIRNPHCTEAVCVRTWSAGHAIGTYMLSIVSAVAATSFSKVLRSIMNNACKECDQIRPSQWKIVLEKCNIIIESKCP